jgi:hypothetical protein
MCPGATERGLRMWYRPRAHVTLLGTAMEASAAEPSSSAFGYTRAAGYEPDSDRAGTSPIAGRRESITE